MAAARTSFIQASWNLLRTVLVTTLLLLSALPTGATAQQVQEYDIKAVFLLNLMHFVNWPATVEHGTNNFIIGIYGTDPFGPILDKAIEGERKFNSSIKIQRYSELNQLDPMVCNILFIHETKLEDWDIIQQHFSGYPVLLVADTSGFPEQGGMVNLLKTRQKIQVEINPGAVKESGLSMSSKILNLARIVQ
jgi:hypothetical protein